MPVTANQKQSDLDDKAQHDTLLKQYEIQWQDHFQTRSQTWKGLEISVILAVALVGLDWKIDHQVATCIAAALLILVALFGMQITIRHRNKVEVKKFEIISDLERQLNLENHPLPPKITFWDVFRIRKSNTSLFILRMQFVLLVFAVTYFVFRLFSK